ncbi:heme binding [Homalodisca vitripennis]|nr:heme binding [Homalodisca vitripennis]
MTYLDQSHRGCTRCCPHCIIEEGTLVVVPVAALHQDPQYYPDPSQFDPESFEGNNFKPSSTFLPFGDGPKICIAISFAVMEVKACVARIVSQYTVKFSNKTQLPLQFDIPSFLPTTYLLLQPNITHIVYRWTKRSERAAEAVLAIHETLTSPTLCHLRIELNYRNTFYLNIATRQVNKSVNIPVITSRVTRIPKYGL